MRSLRLRRFAIFGVAAICGGMLLHVSQHVQKAEYELRTVKAELAKQGEAMRVLNAEWAYLNSPARLEMFAEKYYGLGPVDSQQFKVELPASAVEELSPLFTNILQVPEPLSVNDAEDENVFPFNVAPAPGRKPISDQQRFESLLEMKEGGR